MTAARAERSGADFIWRRYTILGDTAAMQGRYAEALEYYAESLEEAARWEHDMQILRDLMGTALALASSGQDAEAIEVVTMAERHATEIGGRASRAFHMFSGEPIVRAEQRLGPAGLAQATRRGEAVPAAQRVTRTCELCRTSGAERLALNTRSRQLTIRSSGRPWSPRERRMPGRPPPPDRAGWCH
jgi:hypothetical protein